MDEDQVLNSTAFSWNEIRRLIELIPKTDPTTHQYGILLESLERYGAIMKFIDWFLSVKVQNPEDIKPEETDKTIIPFPAPAAEEEPEEVEEDITYDKDTVRKALLDARMKGKLGSAKQWIREEFGLDSFDAIPAAKYGEVMAKLEGLG